MIFRAPHLFSLVAGLALGGAAAFLTRPTPSAPAEGEPVPALSITYDDPNIREIAASAAGTFATLYDKIMHRKTTDETERYYLRSLLCDRWLDIDPKEAAAKLIAPDADPFPQLAAPVAKAWASSDPIAAVEWARNLPPARGANAHETAVTPWSAHQPQPAAACALALPEGDLRNSLLYHTGVNLFRSDVAAGETWLRSLSTKSERVAGRQAIAVGVGLEAEQTRLRKILGE